jgi:DNA-binding CsgD family transcriptional regulator
MQRSRMADRQIPDVWLPEDAADDERRLRVVFILVLIVTIVGGGIDLALDAPASWVSPHVIFELALMSAALATSVWLWRGWRRSRRTLATARNALADQVAQRDAWRSSAEGLLAPLGKAIDSQLAAWDLTPVERDIALQLLKGRSHKQIAYSSGRSERTVRQHAVAIYQKSGLSGRAALAAFFLEGIPDSLPRLP